jgi:hypothetical protein
MGAPPPPAEPVRRTATNSSTDSEMKGLFGISGDAYILPIIGLFATALLYFRIQNAPHSDPFDPLGWAVTLAPTFGTFGFVFYFLVNRPKRFRHDWLDGALNGPHYNHRAQRRVRHPYAKLR